MDLPDVCLFLHECQERGQDSVLVTVCAVEGSSMRNPGTIMGIAQDGSFAGSLSGGCIEQAVVAEALDVLKTGVPRVVRFGAGSPYLDIKLPCGGGLDLHFCPLGRSDFASGCLRAIRGRIPFSIRVGAQAAEPVSQWCKTAFNAETGEGVFGHWPTPRLQIIGHGAGVEALARLGRTMGCNARVLTPDERIIKALRADGVEADLIKRRTQIEMLQSDAWTANIFLFHDHDWEIDLIAGALLEPHFYIGAMGGRKAHAMRSDGLQAKGITQAQLETIRAPIGVFHSSRDPQTLALSTLTEVIRTYQGTDFGAAFG
ncbi:MAG: XdhC family protein [Erythrobacter sp.]